MDRPLYLIEREGFRTKPVAEWLKHSLFWPQHHILTLFSNWSISSWPIPLRPVLKGEELREYAMRRLTCCLLSLRNCGVKVSPMLAFRSIFSPGPEMPPFPGFPNKAHRSPVHLIHFIPIPGRPRPLSECNRQKQVYLTYFNNIILSFCCQK